MLQIQHTSNSFSIFINDQLRLYHHNVQLPLILLGKGKADYQEHLGSFKIKEKIVEKIPVSSFKLIEETAELIKIKFVAKDNSFYLLLQKQEERWVITFPDLSLNYNRFWINLPAEKDEALYGSGEQFSEFNLAHQSVPIWVQEQGIGRKGFVSCLANLLEGAGGSKFHTYYVQPSFVSLKGYYIHVKESAYGKMMFHKGIKPRPYHQLYFWQVPSKIYIGVFNSFFESVSQLNKFLGIQPRLPEWVYSGMWLAIQGEGGIERVKERLNKALNTNIQISAIWSQDWQGILKTFFGTQLFWDWKWDGPGREIRFPNFPDFVKEIQQKGIRYLGYINPFLYEEGMLFKEAKRNGYLVKDKTGNVYITKTTSFNVGILDLTNPDAFTWIKKVIKNNLIEEAGLSGWMADFGEYLPTDGLLHSKEDPQILHNQYPVLWDKANYEAVKEVNKLGEIVYFTRSGYSGASQYTTAVWAGDQMTNWGYHDGLASVIPAALSLGLSGIGYHCSDIGGFTSLKWIKRSKELFIRWAEQAAFTMIMRTHESNRPELCWQFDSDQETLDHLGRMTRIHVNLKPYLLKLSEEYQSSGIPPIRPLVLHYPNDPNTHSLKYQYLLGRDLLIAPVLKKGKKKWKVYLPEGQWIHLWSEDQFSQGTHKIDSPWGFPPVFYSSQSDHVHLFHEIFEKYGYYS